MPRRSVPFRRRRQYSRSLPEGKDRPKAIFLEGIAVGGGNPVNLCSPREGVDGRSVRSSPRTADMPRGRQSRGCLAATVAFDHRLREHIKELSLWCSGKLTAGAGFTQERPSCLLASSRCHQVVLRSPPTPLRRPPRFRQRSRSLSPLPSSLRDQSTPASLRCSRSPRWGFVQKQLKRSCCRATSWCWSTHRQARQVRICRPHTTPSASSSR